MRPRSLLLPFLLALILQACLVVPVTRQEYDPECRVSTHHMTLQPVQLGYVQGCANEGCAAALVAFGAVAAASAVVSGSIVVVGNVVYWTEKQGRCQRDGAAPSRLPPPEATRPAPQPEPERSEEEKGIPHWKGW